MLSALHGVEAGVGEGDRWVVAEEDEDLQWLVVGEEIDDQPEYEEDVGGHWVVVDEVFR